jgi:hypothetical protein
VGAGQRQGRWLPCALVGRSLGAAAASGKGRPGEIDYRLARASRLAAYRTGRASRSEVCDAQTELLRNAAHCARATRRTCPICEHQYLVEVTYVFGPRLPKSGRCITGLGELATLASKPGRHEAYVVEVCTECRWNHLTRSFPLAADPT